jgi:SAM-dependent methyltransferase
MSPGYSGNISYRRWLLNLCLAKHSDIFSGTSGVFNVGGKREIGIKGCRNPVESVGTWIYSNIDATSNPDIVTDVTEIPLQHASFDVLACTEVLERLATPALYIDEIWRVLKPDGVFIGSAPFVFPVNGDASDYYRYSDSGLCFLLQKFSVVNIEPMGGSLGTMGLLLEQELTTFVRSRFMRSFMRRLAVTMSRKDYKVSFEGSKRLTTGWFWRCTR